MNSLMNKKISAVILGVAVGALSLSGCATQAMVHADANSTDDQTVVKTDYRPSDEQSAALEDETITRDEYTSAYEQYKACLAAAGFRISEVDSNAVILEYAVPAEAVSSGVDDDCYGTHFALVDAKWQISNFASSETADFLRQCLTEHGVTPSEDSGQLEQQLEEIGVSPTEC